MTVERKTPETPHTPVMTPPPRPTGPGAGSAERPGPSADSPHVSGPHPPFAPPEERIETVEPQRSSADIEKRADVE